MGLRIGIIGAGYIGHLHASVLAQDKRVTVASVYDVDKARAERLCSLTGAAVALSEETLLDAVDAVYITTPNTKHVELVLAALAKHVHVFVEKPMATSLREAGQILDASQRSKALLQVGHNRRFAPVYKQAKRLLVEGGFKPYSAHIKMNRGELQNPPWVANARITGGFLYETTIHLFDMARWLFGDVASLFCIGRSNCYPELDDFSLVLTFSSGLHATFASSAHASWFFPFERIEIFGDHATIETQEMEKISFVSGLDREVVTQDFFQQPKEQKWGYGEENTLFVDSILQRTPPVVSALDGYKAVELVEACYLGCKTRSEIKLPLG